MAGDGSAVRLGQQPNCMTVLCVHTQVHDLYQGGSRFNRPLPVEVSTWGSESSPAMFQANGVG